MTPEEAVQSFVEAEAELRQVVEASKRLDSAQESLEAARSELVRSSAERAASHTEAVRELDGASSSLLDAAAEVEHASHSLQETAAALGRLVTVLGTFQPEELHAEIQELRTGQQRSNRLMVAVLGILAAVLVLLVVVISK